MTSVSLVSEVDRVREFYVLTGYKGSVGHGDIVVGASRGEDLVGVVRIANEHGIEVLRGMRVKPEFQRQGVGRQMLERIRSLLEGRECFAIAYAHLEGFYGGIGFRKSDEREAPPFLRERIEKYREENPERDFILIRRPGLNLAERV